MINPYYHQAQQRIRIGRRILYWRGVHEWTQKDLAALLGVPAATLAGWERGQARPKPDRLEQLARVLDCPLADLLGQPPGPGPQAGNPDRMTPAADGGRREAHHA